MDTVPQTIEESWDQDSEARLSAQCIAERVRSFSHGGRILHRKENAKIQWL